MALLVDGQPFGFALSLKLSEAEASIPHRRALYLTAEERVPDSVGGEGAK